MWTGALAAVPWQNPTPANVRMTGEQTDQVLEAIEHAVADAELTVDELTDAVSTVLAAYLHAFGPSTRPGSRTGWPCRRRGPGRCFSDQAESLERVEVDGEVAWVRKGDTEVPDDPPRGLRLLPYFDAYAYSVGNDRARLYPGVAARRAAGNFQVLLVDGVVGGLWHQRRSARWPRPAAASWTTRSTGSARSSKGRRS